MHKNQSLSCLQGFIIDAIVKQLTKAGLSLLVYKITKATCHELSDKKILAKVKLGKSNYYISSDMFQLIRKGHT